MIAEIQNFLRHIAVRRCQARKAEEPPRRSAKVGQQDYEPICLHFTAFTKAALEAGRELLYQFRPEIAFLCFSQALLISRDAEIAGLLHIPSLLGARHSVFQVWFLGQPALKTLTAERESTLG